VPNTFGDLKESSIINISGVSSTGPSFAQLINSATQRLLRRGDWVGTVVPIFSCVFKGCVVWPRYVKDIRRLNVCKHRFAPVQNMWWDFLPFDGKRGWRDQSWSSYCGPQVTAMVQPKVPVFQDIQGDGRTLRAYPATPLDNNKTVTVFGTDNNGQPLMTTGAGGFTMGIKAQLKLPYVEFSNQGTSVLVRSIDRVIKDRTQGPVRLYAWNSSASVLEDVAYYEGSETNPSYLKTQIHTGGCGCNSNADGSAATFGVIAIVKLAFVPVVNDDDLVLIDNVEALKNMVMSIRAEEAVDFETAATYEARAIRSLNLDLADRDEAEQIPVNLGETGREELGLGRQRCF
jgi:hypothetical protein